jgi:ferredoxin--NADP+ reductase
MTERKIPLNIYKISDPFMGTVRQNLKLTRDSSPNDTRHVVIDLEGSRYEYLEGQSAGVLPPGINEKGKPHSVRLYSIASHRYGEGGHPKRLSLCVKRVIYQDPGTRQERHGVASNYICDLMPGDQVKLTGPAGNRFLLPEQFLDHHYVFIATGTGIAPFRGMLYQLFHHEFRGEVWLIFGVQYRSDILYEKEFHQHEAHPNFHFVTAISREETNSDGSKVYVQHRLLDYKNELASLMARTNTLIYICGISGMEKGIGQALQTIFSTEIYEQVKKRVLVEVY